MRKVFISYHHKNDQSYKNHLSNSGCRVAAFWMARCAWAISPTTIAPRRQFVV
mgnify:CR=1 FL=1